MMPLEIQKYGGTSMADAMAVEHSGPVVIDGHRGGKAVLVVVSAMSGVTSQLHDAVLE